MARIFISYRRDDTKVFSARIHDRLVREFGRNNVFFDVDNNIPAGSTWQNVLSEALEQSDVLLVIIGDKWETIINARSEGGDWVRFEIEHGLNRDDMLVIPVLIEDTRVPRKLPDSIRKLTDKQTFTLRHDPYFNAGMQQLNRNIRDWRRIQSTRMPYIVGTIASLIIILTTVFLMRDFIFINNGMNSNDTQENRQNLTATQAVFLTSEALAGQNLVLSPPSSTNTPEPTAVPPDEDKTFGVGIQIQVPTDLNPDVMNGWYRSAQEMNVNWVKIQVRWENVEPEQGQYDWQELDLAMAGARFFGIRPMLSIVTAPDWARGVGREVGISTAQHGPPGNNEDYVTFVRAIFEQFPGQVYAIEVWNEQNLNREWTSMQGLSASNYVSLLGDTYNMVQEVSPGTIVISGALSPTGLDDGIGAIDDFRYMQLMIDNGLLDVTDCVGAHHNGYNIGPLVPFDNVPNDPTASFRGPFDNPHHSWSFRSTLDGYTDRIRNAGSNTKLCITEFGWAVTEDLSGFPRGFEFANDNTLEEQAQFFVEALESMSNGDDVWLAFVWNLNYGPQAGWDATNDNVPYSLVGPGNTFRPAYDAIRDWMASYGS